MIPHSISKRNADKKTKVFAAIIPAALVFGAMFYFCLSPSYAEAAEVLQEITVKEGDTLWSISNFYLKDPRRWPDILKHNPRLSNDPNIVLPGMRIQVPIFLIKEHLRAAYLVYIFQDVRFRRRREAEWKRAWPEMELYEDDGVRTLEKSQANVKLPSGELLRLFENSLLIVKPEKMEDQAELVAGEVRSSKTKIITAETVVRPQITAKTETPDFKTKIKADKTTLVEVYKGVIDVTAQGRTVTVSEGFGTEVKFRAAPSIPLRLPEMPDVRIDATDAKTPAAKDGKLDISLIAPESGSDHATRSLREGAARGTTQKPSDGASSRDDGDDKSSGRIIGSAVKKYRLQISTSRAFSQIVHEEIKDLKSRISLDFTQMSLPDGFYCWRVSYIDQLGFEGRFSEPRGFIVDTTPPAMELFLPEEGAEYDTEFIYVEGRTETEVSVTVNDVPTNTGADGKFLYAILSKEGVVKVKIVATDRAGNATVAERTVMKVRKGTAAKRHARPLAAGGRKASGTSITLPIAILTISIILGVVLILARP
ncbi:MAG: LysM peptidoglycan-binding domain-containing protein [Endomicrobiia bacterium]|nr:LysM peptidoglycan-binding domain-containing protein [Endomicrobiia bacterium]